MRRTTTQLSIIPFAFALLTGCFAAPDGSGIGGNGNGGGNGDGNGGNWGGSEGDSGIEVDEDALGPDGCPTVQLSPEEWAPISAMYTGGDDPFFQLHDNEAGFYFNLEAYTVWGSDWTGQTGTYDADCNGTGLCVWLVPDDVHPYLAVVGDVDIVSLSETGGAVDLPIEVVVRDLTFVPTGDDAPFECLHVEEVSFRK